MAEKTTITVSKTKFMDSQTAIPVTCTPQNVETEVVDGQVVPVKDHREGGVRQ